MRYLKKFEMYKESDFFIQISNLEFWQKTGRYPLMININRHRYVSERDKFVKMGINFRKKTSK